MDSLLSAITGIAKIANLILAAYLLSILAQLYRAEKHTSFSRTVHIMLIAIVLFFVIEIIQFFRLLPAEAFEPIQSFFSFIFLLMLVAAMLEVKKSMLAHDHMMRRKLREKMHDVE
jgi:small-conductance mechanosensitive channel